ncbi:unnamed protein product [Chrysoparadoxa australica]
MCRDLLAQFLGLGREDPREQAVATDFHFYNYAFCKERRFNTRKTSTLLSILQDILLEDTKSPEAAFSISKSFQRFKELLLKHSVERPPWSSGVFDPADVHAITDFVTNSYYRHFKLYKGVFTDRVNTKFEQRNCLTCEFPMLPVELSHAELQAEQEEGGNEEEETQQWGSTK